MKLETTIAPRRDGTVRLTVADGTEYKFAQDAECRLVCEVEEQHIAPLLESGNFVPANEEDFDVANALLAGGADDDETGDEGDEGDEGDDDSPGAAPIEAGTPPAPPKGKRAKRTQKAE